MNYPLAFQAAPGAVYRSSAPQLGGVPVRGQPMPGNIGGLPTPQQPVKGNRTALQEALARKQELDAIREGEEMARRHAQQMGLPMLPQAQPQPQLPMRPPMQGGMVNGKLPIRTAPAAGMMNGGTPFRYRMSRG
jgi:hypothetical protein